MIENLDIRTAVHDKGILYKDIADILGITPEYLSRFLRYPLSDEKKQEIFYAINKIETERKPPTEKTDNENEPSGKWIMQGSVAVCSRCSFGYKVNPMDMKFCPNCGRKMEINL